MMIFWVYFSFGADPWHDTTARASAHARTTAQNDFTGSLFVRRIGVSLKYSVRILAGLTASAPTSLVELRRGLAVALRAEADKATACPPKLRAKAEVLRHEGTALGPERG
jgi:hypothetical protein